VVAGGGFSPCGGFFFSVALVMMFLWGQWCRAGLGGWDSSLCWLVFWLLLSPMPLPVCRPQKALLGEFLEALGGVLNTHKQIRVGRTSC
jgi:hypothetical protein